MCHILKCAISSKDIWMKSLVENIEKWYLCKEAKKLQQRGDWKVAKSSGWVIPTHLHTDRQPPNDLLDVTDTDFDSYWILGSDQSQLPLRPKRNNIPYTFFTTPHLQKRFIPQLDMFALIWEKYIPILLLPSSNMLEKWKPNQIFSKVESQCCLLFCDARLRTDWSHWFLW